jgi:hypothetical protein
MLITGSCHCRNITFRLNWTPEPTEIPARACTCSFCSKRGGLWTSCPAGALEISVQDPKLLSRYLFGTRTAEFLVCAKCGVAPAVTSLIKDRLYAVVSVNAFDNVDSSMIRRAAATFDGESEEVRLTRRAQNWISSVTVVYGSA